MMLTCKKVSGKLKWVSTPVTSKPAKSTPTPAAPKVGTFSKPVPVGTFATIGSFKYRLDSSVNDVTASVCASNGFNEGCTYDSNFDKIIDPKATGRWLSISVTTVNTGQDIARPAGYATSFELVLPTGKLLSNYSTGIDGDLDAVSLIPGGQSTGVITFYLEKNIALPDLIVLRDRASFTNSATVYYTVPK
jgi:NADH:ubiquinone oxidoreductase subunit F (NADH-binding)